MRLPWKRSNNNKKKNRLNLQSVDSNSSESGLHMITYHFTINDFSNIELLNRWNFPIINIPNGETVSLTMSVDVTRSLGNLMKTSWMLEFRQCCMLRDFNNEGSK